jgi:nucleoside-diphosphate-sugar epimerase
LPVDEKHPLSAKNPYTESKLIGERLCAAYLRDFGIRATILRMFNVYGPGQSASFLIPQLVHQAHIGRIEIADEAPIRDYVFVDDVAEAFVSAVVRDERAVSVYNIGTGIGTSVAELVSLIQRHVGVPCEVNCLHRRRPGEILATVADVSLAKAELSWEPRTPICEGIAHSVAACSDRVAN